MTGKLKNSIFRLLRKDPEAVVVSFASGDPELSARMFAQVRQLVPDRRHFLVTPQEYGGAAALRRRFRRYRIGLAPVLFTSDERYRPLRRAAFLLAPTKILAYNSRLERHHLRIRTLIASYLFLHGVPLDRIFLRPKWLAPWKRERSEYPDTFRVFEGRPFSAYRRRAGILTPYYPYPLSHGGAVRIYSLLREIAKEFDVVLFSFSESSGDEQIAPVAEWCARIVLVDKPRYREPRWSSMRPPEVEEFASPVMYSLLSKYRKEWNIEVLQVEYTALAPYRGEVLVEHDVTYSLYSQIYRREQTVRAWWDYWRWRRFERHWVQCYPRVAVMSAADAALLPQAPAVVIPNGVDLDRFVPQAETEGRRVLFVGSFRHFPNMVAFRFFWDQVWPEVRRTLDGVELDVIAGPDPDLYWREWAPSAGLASGDLPEGEGLSLYPFVSDVRPFYVAANLVIVPTLVSAGTNLKVLEALAMERAIVSTSSGCAGLGLQHGVNVWIADAPLAFADAITGLLQDGGLRRGIAVAGRKYVAGNFDWTSIGERQRELLRSFSGDRPALRKGRPSDLPALQEIQGSAPGSSQWTPAEYLLYDCDVAVIEGLVAGFLVCRHLTEGEREILNLAVHPDYRGRGVATALLQAELARWPGEHFLEVRESNTAARRLYGKLGFEQTAVRPGYYDDPSETGIVMRFRT